ncbi:MAG: hypothetical protein H7A21_08485 [Spirochaetales bacterium]|nr:hypothetical protein [Spirochaetales bacterium]
MLLGKIQSGKTRTFMGILALAFDNGFDFGIILTKGTVALARQTYERLLRNFVVLEEQDLLRVHDIMQLPNNLTTYEIQQKHLIVCKKEIRNLDRLNKALTEVYPEFAKKRALIVDDEADFASLGFQQTRGEGLRIRRIAEAIDQLRGHLDGCSFLQVTATPYSLYLQPEDLRTETEEFRPIRPAFTELVPIHDQYVGGDVYFVESRDEESLASHIFEEIEPRELAALRRSDARRLRIDEVLTSNTVRSLRHALLTFIVGAIIRRIQMADNSEVPSKYSFVIHTETSRRAHDWQERVATTIIERLKDEVAGGSALGRSLVDDAIARLEPGIRKAGLGLPPATRIHEAFQSAVDMVMVTVVNSESEVSQLLDRDGQLRLRTPLNIFIGGQILDRGLTITNLIGFYYGRNPRRFQQDTVLQHSRMYGARSRSDLAVTRFYTTRHVYEVMAHIHEMDSALRDAFEKDGDDAGVIFVQRDGQDRIIPCSPNKVLLSSTVTLRPHRRLLPTGFQTGPKSRIERTVQKIDRLLAQHAAQDDRDPFLWSVEEAEEVLSLIESTFDSFEPGFRWDKRTLPATIRYLSYRCPDAARRGRLFGLVRRGRDARRILADGRFAHNPDSADKEGAVARRFAINLPILMLFRQTGEEEKGWRGTPFWWPVLMAPSDMPPLIFAEETSRT